MVPLKGQSQEIKIGRPNKPTPERDACILFTPKK
jgi:hypothetical protein